MTTRATSVDPYQPIAALYDREHDGYHDDIDLLLSLAGTIDGPILEMGCGSGRVLAPLAEAGHQVTGVDTSAAMLEHAVARLGKAGLDGNVTLVTGDMGDATTVPGGPFGMVIFSLNALMHLVEPDAQVEALANTAKALAPDGLVVVDLANPTPPYLAHLASAPALEWSATMDDGTTVDKWGWRAIDPVSQVIDTIIWYDEVSTGGSLVRRRTQFGLRYIHANELRLMLRLAGFGTVSIHGNYELSPLTADSDRIFAIAALSELAPSGSEVDYLAEPLEGVT